MDAWQVLLLVELTVDLDVVARMYLLSFFVDACEKVIYSPSHLPLPLHAHAYKERPSIYKS